MGVYISPLMATWALALVVGVAVAETQAAPDAPNAVRVSVAKANVRLRPSLQAPVIASYAADTLLETKGKQGEWYEVLLPSEGAGERRTGFIAARLVEPHSIEALPPPAPVAEAPKPAEAAAPPPLPETDARMFPETATVPAAAPTQALSPSAPRRQQNKGDQEVVAFGNLAVARTGGNDEQGTTASTSGFGTIYLNYGKFISDQNEIGGGPTIGLSQSGSGTSATIGLNGFFRRYFAPKGQWYPWLGADLFVQDLTPGSDVSDELQGLPPALRQQLEEAQPGVLDVTYLQLGGGGKNYLTEHLAIDLKASLGLSLGNPGGGWIFQVIVGFSYVF